MKTRAFWYSLVVGVVSLTSGCCCFHDCFPNLGWRFHQGCQPCAPSCAPCSPCGSFRPPMVVGGGPDCPGCAMGAPVTQPAGYPPVIGKPMPIPGASIVPELHPPAPVTPAPKN